MTEKDEMTTDLALIPVQPLFTPEEAAAAARRFKRVKAELLDKNDYVFIAGENRIKKSGFRKLLVAFGLSDRIVDKERTDRDDGSFTWRITVEVKHPNGRVCSGIAVCDSRERNYAHLEHDVLATCHTRAKNRAISDMIAGGVVSAEEMLGAAEAAPKTILSTVILKKDWDWNRVFTDFGPQIEKRQKELGEDNFTFEFAAVVVAREKGLVKEPELPI